MRRLSPYLSVITHITNRGMTGSKAGRPAFLPGCAGRQEAAKDFI
jgi:hypothetical protein